MTPGEALLALKESVSDYGDSRMRTWKPSGNMSWIDAGWNRSAEIPQLFIIISNVLLGFKDVRRRVRKQPVSFSPSEHVPAQLKTYLLVLGLQAQNFVTVDTELVLLVVLTNKIFSFPATGDPCSSKGWPHVVCDRRIRRVVRMWGLQILCMAWLWSSCTLFHEQSCQLHPRFVFKSKLVSFTSPAISRFLYVPTQYIRCSRHLCTPCIVLCSHLADMDVAGTLPNALAKLNKLKLLDLSNNKWVPFLIFALQCECTRHGTKTSNASWSALLSYEINVLVVHTHLLFVVLKTSQVAMGRFSYAWFIKLEQYVLVVSAALWGHFQASTAIAKCSATLKHWISATTFWQALCPTGSGILWTFSTLCDLWTFQATASLVRKHMCATERWQRLLLCPNACAIAVQKIWSQQDAFSYLPQHQRDAMCRWTSWWLDVQCQDLQKPAVFEPGRQPPGIYKWWGPIRDWSVVPWGAYISNGLVSTSRWCC